jgi:GMP synthase (glutamine-hydrolysing)
VFTVPAGARRLGDSDAGPQGFVVESGAGVAQLVAWQFHPEVTPGTLARWVDEDGQTLPRVGVDGAAVVAEAVAREANSRASAYALVDVTLDAMGLLRADPEAVPRAGEAG